MTDEKEILNKALILHNNGEFNEAEKLYRQIIHQNPDNDDVTYLLGILAYQTGNIDSAKDYLIKAIETNPKEVYYKDLAGMLFDSGNKQDAIYYYKKILELNINDIQSWFNLGLAYMETKNIDEAIKSFTSVVNINPDDSETLGILGNLYLNNKRDPVNAIAYFQKALSLKPDNHITCFNLGLAYASMDNLDMAMGIYQNALAIKPDFAEAYINLGAAYIGKNEINKAIECYKKGIDLFPDNDSLLFNLGCALLRTKDMDQGWKYYEYRAKIFLIMR